jgi:hypothetical protein
MRASLLLVVTAVFEGATGLLLLLAPALVLSLLFGWRQIGPDTALIGRVAGAAVLGLSAASWLARDDAGSRAGLGVLTGLLVYNVVAAVLVVFVGVVLSMVGLLLWPAALYHVALTAWSVDCLRRWPEVERR